MGTVLHKNLSGTDLHEPKGADGATAGKAYISDGSGSGNWKEIPVAEDGAANEYFVSDGAGSGSWEPVTASIHAAAKVSGNATTIAGGTGVYAEWTPTLTSIDEDGVTVSANSFVIVTPGSYRVEASLSHQGQNAVAKIYGFDFAKNGTVVAQKSRQTTTSATDINAVQVTAYLADLAANDTIKLYVTCETDTTNVLITDANFFIYRTG